jgi:hypothetical protein
MHVSSSSTLHRIIHSKIHQSPPFLVFIHEPCIYQYNTSPAYQNHSYINTTLVLAYQNHTFINTTPVLAYQNLSFINTTPVPASQNHSFINAAPTPILQEKFIQRCNSSPSLTQLHCRHLTHPSVTKVIHSSY